MFKPFLRRLTLILSAFVALNSVAPVQAMDSHPEHGSLWLTKSLIALATPMALYGWLFFKHQNQLNTIERKLDRSTLAATAKDTNFMCATWRSHKENTPSGLPWEFPQDIWNDRAYITNIFITDATQFDDRVYIYSHGVRYEPQQLAALSQDKCRAVIAQAIANEKKWLEEQMAYVAQFTDLPDLVVEALTPEEGRMLEPHELAFGCACKIKELDFKGLSEMVGKLQVHAESASHLKTVIHCAGWMPTTWSLAPCYKDASRIYLKLLLIYARLCALDAAWLNE